MQDLFSAGSMQIDLPTSEELQIPENGVKLENGSVQTRFQTD